MGERIYGVVIGLVRDVHDPEEQGRVKVSYPWLSADDSYAGWAPVARPMAGKERGYWYAPEVDDEVLVAFEHGDLNHPMVLGFLHNGVDKPPGTDVNVRRVRTVSGNVLDFNDNSGQEQIHLHTRNGTKVTINETPSEITLETVGGQKVMVSDASGVTVFSPAAGVSVTSATSMTTSVGQAMSVTAGTAMDVTAGTTVQVTAGGVVNVTAGASVNVTASMVNVTAPLTQVSGVLKCGTLLADVGVISPMYTPGVGNIW
jgi:uncharacterized protein involved in type VI secretion and phage assembly